MWRRLECSGSYLSLTGFCEKYDLTWFMLSGKAPCLPSPILSPTWILKVSIKLKLLVQNFLKENPQKISAERNLETLKKFINLQTAKKRTSGTKLISPNLGVPGNQPGPWRRKETSNRNIKTHCQRQNKPER